MADLKAFVLWFISELPDFLLTPPISLFTGFFFAGCTINLFKQLINVSRR